MNIFKTGLFSLKDVEQRDAHLFDWQLSSVEPYGHYSAYDYLHGFCDIFAICLNDLFGYKIEWVIEDSIQECEYENPNPCDFLAHAYCVHSKYYLDVRGANTNGQEFFEEFEDFFDYPGLDIPCPEKEEFKSIVIKAMGEEFFNQLYKEAEKYIIAHKGWFNFHR